MRSNSVLQVVNVSKAFDGLAAVRGLSLDVPSQGVTSLIGANGAGKTTLFNLISGFEKPDGGAIYFNGLRIDGTRPDAVARLGIGRLFQDVRVFNKLTVLENVLVALSGFPEMPFRPTFRWGEARRHERAAVEAAERCLEQLGLSDRLSARAEALSYGQQKLLALGRLIAADFEFLLLDEPTSGVSSAMVERILGLIRNMAAQGRTVLIIEHGMKVVKEISDWVHFLSGGQVMCSGPPALVLNDPVVRRTYLLV
jgi:ABC-type branched-subunit amino acid transport system ATPase component